MLSRASGTTLWLGIHCPALPLIAVWGLLPESGPVAVHETFRGQARVVQASRAALRAGARTNQRLADALTIVPTLDSRPRSHDMEERALDHMALIAYGHSHQVIVAGPDTVLLEIGGSRKLRGSTDQLIDLLAGQLELAGFPVRFGLAITATPACLLARMGLHTNSREQLKQVLDKLTVDRLELSDDEYRALSGCGLETVGALLQVPAPERERRFGRKLNEYLACLTAEHSPPLQAWQPPDRYAWHLELPDATTDSAALLFACRRIIEHLDQWLTIRDRALIRLHIALTPEDDGKTTRLAVGLVRPGMNAGHLLELIRLKLESLKLPSPVAGIQVSAETTSEHRPPQSDLFSGHNRADAWPALLDRLTARLGEDGISSLVPCADHRPEKAWAWAPPGQTRPCEASLPRPTWLLPSPRPCQREHMALESGPERIEAGWWDGENCSRDYWVARDRDGRRLWIFCEHQPRQGWFIHGLFG